MMINIVKENRRMRLERKVISVMVHKIKPKADEIEASPKGNYTLILCVHSNYMFPFRRRLRMCPWKYSSCLFLKGHLHFFVWKVS